LLPVDARDRAAGERARQMVRNRPAQAVVVDLQGGDAPTRDVRRDTSARRLDFGKLGHRSGWSGA